MEPGICYIKKEYLVAETKKPATNENQSDDSTQKRKLECAESVDEVNNVTAGEDAPANKYHKTNKKTRNRGQNKNRPIFKEDRTLHLCNSLVNGPNAEKCSTLNCRYVHDLEAYLSSKGEDLGDTCAVFEVKGFCPRGVTCRFSKAHINENGHNIKSPEYNEEKSRTTINGITPELQVRLRKRDYDFSKSKNLVEKFEKARQERKQSENHADPIDEKTVAVDKPIGAVIEDDAHVKKSKVDFSEKLLLSPLTTVGNLPFRRICKEFGADITCGEMACSVPLVKGLIQEWALTKRHASEDVFGVQLCGNNASIIAQTAQLIQENAEVDFIDLNIGCPIDLIYQQGGGSALMRRTNVLETVVRSCSALLKDTAFTVKMRTGVYADKSVAHDLAPLVEEWGADAVTLHGRSREQRYTKTSNWEYIEKCAAKVKRIPVIGNGDILNYEDYNDRRRIAPHVSSVMIGRGALIKPWIFKEIKEQKHWDPSSGERFEMLQKFANYGLEHWGSDTKGVENTRRFLLEWQSFLYRYIPYSLIEHPPQKINQRPEKYRGRDEMETLLSSPQSSDWVKLSEMLLGRVPEGFTFVPKHKANAY